MKLSSILPFAAPGLVGVPTSTWARFGADSEAFLKWSPTTLRYIAEQAYCDLFSLALADIMVWDQLRDE